jgi:hypothetical protein
MSGVKIGFNEGSLLRRTLLHVSAFVLGSVVFVGTLSIVLVSIAKSVGRPASAAESPASSAALEPVGAKTKGLNGATAATSKAPPRARTTPQQERPKDDE